MKIGLVGAGRQGWRRAAAIRATRLGKLAIVADLDELSARGLAQSFSCDYTTKWRNVVNSDVDALIVCTPPDTHAEIAISALRNEKHVLCEKPLGRTVAEAKRIEAEARRHKVKMKCGFNYRFHSGITQARRWMGEKAIGRPYFVRCVHGITGRLGYEKDWRADLKISGGGQLLDQGIHCLDLFRCFLGEFSEAFAFTQTYFWKTKVEDNVFGLLRTPARQVATLHVSWTEWKNKFHIEIVGNEGYIAVEGLGGSYGTERAVMGKRMFDKPFEEKIIEYRGEDVSWKEEWRNFTQAIKNDTALDGSVKDGVRAQALTQALYDSARRHRLVRIS